MPDIKMKIGERRQEAEIKLLEMLESHGWGRLDILGVLDSDRPVGEKVDIVYIDAETQKPERMDLSDIDELMDKLEQGGGYLAVTDKNKASLETHMIAVKKINDLYVIADAPAGENMEGKIYEAMEAEATGELGFFEGIIEALKEFIDNVVNGLEIFRNRMPEDAYTRYNTPHQSFVDSFRGMENDEKLMFAQFNSAMLKVFKDYGQIRDIPFAGGIVAVEGQQESFEKRSKWLDSYVKKGDLFRLDLNSPEAYTIVNVLDNMYNKIGFSGNSSAFRDIEIDGEFMDTLHIIQDLHRMKSDAEVTRGNLADLTNKQYANMDGNQKGEFEKNIVKLIKAELATECLAVLPAAGKNVPERLKKLEGMMDMLRSVDECQPLKEAIQDSMKPNLKETLKSLSEKLKNKEFLKVIQKDMQMKNDANKKETTLHRDNSITNSKKNEHTMS